MWETGWCKHGSRDTVSVNRSQCGFVFEHCGNWNICYCKHSLRRAACFSTTLWLSEPVGLFVTSPCFVDALWLFPSCCPSSPFCLPPSSFSSLLVVFDVRCLAAAFCHAVLLGQSLLLVPLRAPFFTPSLVSVWPVLSAAWNPCPFYSSSLWLFFFSWPLLICSAPDIHSYMPHWSLSAELSITLSLLSPSIPHLPVLLDIIPLLSEICFSLHRATEVFFISDGFISTRLKGWAACEASHFSVSQFRGNYLVSVAHAV